MTHLKYACLLLLLGLAPLSLAAQSSGPLRVHPTNPRYFTDDTGQAILLAGAHTWSNVVDMGPSDPPPPFDFDAYLAWLRSFGHNFTRGWTWETTTWNAANVGWGGWDHTVAPHPWVRTGPELALDGKPKFDLEKINPDYIERLVTRVTKAQQNGIFFSVMLFEGYGIQFVDGAWPSHPFHPENNINGINADKDGDGNGLEVHRLEDPAVLRVQEAYVRAVLDALNDFDNVLYEIGNEMHPSTTEWQYHMIRFIKDHEATLPKQHPVGMTFQHAGGSNQTLFDSPADWISPSRTGGYRDNPPDAKGAKVVISDTDHLWGIGGDADWVWRTTTRGLNPIFMDSYDQKVLTRNHPNFEHVRQSLGHAIAFTKRMDLARATPQDALASSGFCLADPGISYLVFVPGGGEITVNLADAQGTFAVEWHHPATNETKQAEPVKGGEPRTLPSPFEGDSVLFLIAQ
jgi:hypothetical protein